MRQFREDSLPELRWVMFHIEGAGAELARLAPVMEARLLERQATSSYPCCRFAAATRSDLPMPRGPFVPEAFRVAVR